jgi:hypothetical protein
MKTTNQHTIARGLIREINSDIEDLEELTPEFLLDMMGVLGVSFTESDDASIAFIRGCLPPPSAD